VSDLNLFSEERNVPEGLIRDLGAQASDLEGSLGVIARDSGSALHAPLLSFLASIDRETVERRRADESFEFFVHGNTEEQRDRSARLSIACKLIAAEIHMRRRGHLEAQISGAGVAAPYAEPALKGVRIDEQLLVSTKDFDRGCDAYERASWVFHLCPTLLSQPNSVYWVDLVLRKVPETVDVRVRLDPLMVLPAEDYGSSFYKMCAWGRPLDWARLERLGDGASEDARWFPDEGAKTEIAFTDLVWRRTGGELQFVCEEVPTYEASAYRGSRYFHAIYDRTRGSFSHADGAIRFYGGSEIEQRRALHVREAGKVGVRVKIFRADGEIPRDTWCELAGSFFVWNDDMRKYFEGKGRRLARD
jgi:hypothetical protein